MAIKHRNIFWLSYSDLMTSLFFIVLVLYVLTFLRLKNEQKQYVEDAQQYRKLKEIEESIKGLEGESYIYQKKYKRHVLRKKVQFNIESTIIPEKDKVALYKAGKALEKLILNTKRKILKEKINLKYVIIIEGMASKDNFTNNFELSYERALSVYRFWKKKGIVFDKNISEVIISGSGYDGIGRDLKEEKNNQRIIVHILPKFGKL